MAKKNEYVSKKEPKEKKVARTSSTKEAGVSLTKLRSRFSNQRAKTIVGIILILVSFFMAVACFSYFFTWKEDQSDLLSNDFFSYFFSSENTEVQNWMGRMGAWLSHVMLYRWFGLASLFIPFCLALLGIKFLLNIKLLPLKKTLKLSFFGVIWISLFLGLFSNRITYFGGSFGYHINEWMSGSFGKFGTVAIIITIFLILLVVLFNVSIDSIKSLFNKATKDEELISETANKNNINDFHVINDIKDEEIKKDEAVQAIVFGEEDEEEADLEITVKDESVKENIEEEIPLENDLEVEETVVIDETSELSIENTKEVEETSDDEFQVEVAKEDTTELPKSQINSKVEAFGEFDPTLELSSYKLPTIDLLKEYGTGEISVDKSELEANKNKIVETLANYKIEISKIKATIGPTVTLYEIVPAPGVRISKIKNLEDDIALSLAALGIRIIAPIPGKGTVGIEVPNSKPDMVSMRSLIASEKFQNSDAELPIVLGKTITNETFTFDLAKMPHLLVAGATGQGKSVGLNAILVSLLYKKHPSQVKFILVDPKKVELTLYNRIERHFLAKLPDEAEAIITDTSKVVATLNSLCIEMDQRYELLKNAQVRNIKEYNVKFVNRKLNPENGHRYLPYIVVLIDEFADLIMTAGKEVEHPIARIAQLARAIGIHLIVATQRPSVNVITGMIKANFPARIAFRVLSKIDSRTILDAGGADQLIGRGDMLITTGQEMTRLQCGFVDTPEVDDICAFIGEQRAYPEAMLLPEYVDESAEQNTSIDSDERDSMFVDAARLIVMNQQGSTSLVQRKLKLGYNRAGRIIDQLEAHGIVGPSRGSKAREVLMPDDMALQAFFDAKGIE
jgi:S-DNA-T family DNA segregation ATPase FtsK/SpoIIIE